MALDFSKTSSSSLAKNRLQSASENKNADVVVKIPVVDVKPSPFNEGIPMDGIDELAASIKAVGLLDPVVVYRKPDGGYELVSGHRRLQAVLLLGEKTIPAVVRTYPEDALVRFRQHADANVQTRAKSIRFWIAEIAHANSLLNRIGYDGSKEERMEKISEMLGSGASVAQIYRYNGIRKMSPRLLCLDRFGVSAATLYSAVRLEVNQQEELADLCEKYMRDNPDEESLSKAKFLEFVKRVRGEIVSSVDRNTSLGAKRPFYTRMCEMENAYISRLQNAKKKDDVVAALQLISQMRDSLNSVEKELRSRKQS